MHKSGAQLAHNCWEEASIQTKASEEPSWRNLPRPSRFRCVEPTRRDLTCGGALAAFSLLLADLLGTASPVKADALVGPIPTLDRVAVRIVTEDYQFAVAPGRKEDGLMVENFGWGIGPDHPPGRTLVSEFGLSMHVESRRGDETRQVLIDFGFTPEALNNNLALIGVRPDPLRQLHVDSGRRFARIAVIDRRRGEWVNRHRPDLRISGSPAIRRREHAPKSPISDREPLQSPL